MESTLTMASSNLHLSQTKTPFFFINPKSKSTIKASSSTPPPPPPPPPPNPFISHLKTTAAAVIFAAAALNLRCSPAIACVLPPPPTLTQQLDEEIITHEAGQRQETSPLTNFLDSNSETSESFGNLPMTQVVESNSEASLSQKNSNLNQVVDSNFEASESVEKSPLTQFLESSVEGVEALKGLLQQKLEAGEDEEGMKILEKLSVAQPENNEWKFLMARLYNEMGKTQEARDVFEEILKRNPLLFEGLFENALLMDRCGEGEGAIRRLEQALRLAEDEGKVKEARDVRLIIAQVQFLQKNVDEALRSYEELLREDPKDFRPYFCRGMIYSLMDRNEEAREQFAKSRELSPKKFEVEGYLRSPLSRMKLFGTGEDN